ncbi:hypothetical protein Tco_0415411 [Tanacetum coccineum]
MACFPRLEELVVAANSRGSFDGMLVYFEMETAKDLEFAAGLRNLWVELLEHTNERQLFITKLEVRAGGHRTLKLERNSSNKTDGNPLVKISAN